MAAPLRILHVDFGRWQATSPSNHGRSPQKLRSSEEISQRSGNAGFKFVGPVIVYALMRPRRSVLDHSSRTGFRRKARVPHDPEDESRRVSWGLSTATSRARDNHKPGFNEPSWPTPGQIIWGNRNGKRRKSRVSVAPFRDLSEFLMDPSLFTGLCSDQELLL